MKRVTSYNGVDVFSSKAIVIGSGAAALSAAIYLKEFSVDDFVLVTESLSSGTSRNTGSDKQTYYKLSLYGEERDSVSLMAKNIFDGKCVDGDVALSEAASSVRSFMRLVDLGCEFPTDMYGQYIGYKTDHDPFRRATSLGPYTSKRMCQVLLKRANELKVEILDGYQAIRLLSSGGKIRGALFIERKSGNIIAILSPFVVFATGGPAGIYSDSVYPESQFGSTGLAFEIGAKGKNLTEWQFGLASKRPRWNVSGSYMQALPAFVSVDADGNERLFLNDSLKDKGELYRLIFLKGYQWPFDARKAESGSSRVDLIVYSELKKGRRVYLDFRRNPSGGDFDRSYLDSEAYDYLKKASALAETPILRLKAMNKPAYDFYLEKGIDLESDMLEIGLSVQHNNGGLEGDLWWESNVKGLFPIGEVNGSHGVYRPGGSALNSGQVGSLRASLKIKRDAKNSLGIPFDGLVEAAIDSELDRRKSALEGNLDFESSYRELRELMSSSASIIRERGTLVSALDRVESLLSDISLVSARSSERLWLFYEYRNALITSKVYLSAMLDYLDKNGDSRGSAIYVREDGDSAIRDLSPSLRFNLEGEDSRPSIQISELRDDSVIFEYRRPRDIPTSDDSFEAVWKEFREMNNL